MGVTTAVAVETTVRDALAQGQAVYMAGVHGQPRERLEHLGLRGAMREDRWVQDRESALKLALEELTPK
jgi:SulP family sulfate permease